MVDETAQRGIRMTSNVALDMAYRSLGPACDPPARPGGLSRRRFVQLASTASAGAAALLGGLVGFAPSAEAGPPSLCDFQPLPMTGCECHQGIRMCGCIGNCSDTQSRCQFGPRPDLDYCVASNFNPNPEIGAKAYATCDPAISRGWCCGVYC